MAVLTDYKELDVLQGSTGSGGVALTENFKELADRAPYRSATNPGSGNDSTKGFTPGDYWLNTSTLVLWACVSNTASAAVWKSMLLRSATGSYSFRDNRGSTYRRKTSRGWRDPNCRRHFCGQVVRAADDERRRHTVNRKNADGQSG